MKEEQRVSKSADRVSRKDGQAHTSKRRRRRERDRFHQRRRLPLQRSGALIRRRAADGQSTPFRAAETG